MTDRLRVFNVSGVTGWDWWAYHLLSSRRMAVRVWRKLGGGSWVIRVMGGPAFLVEGDDVRATPRVSAHAPVNVPG